MPSSVARIADNTFRGWVGGWGPRYLALKRERGPARVPWSLREDSKVLVRGSLRPGTMNGHGYVTFPSRPVDAVLGGLDVSTGAAWSTGHSAIHSLGHGPWWLFLFFLHESRRCVCRLCTNHLKLVRGGEMNRPKNETEATKQPPQPNKQQKPPKPHQNKARFISQDGRVSQKSGETEYGLGQ